VAPAAGWSVWLSGMVVIRAAFPCPA